MNGAVPITLMGVIAIGGSWRKTGKAPDNIGEALFATGILAAVFALLDETAAAPVTRALAWLMVFTTLSAATGLLQKG